MLEGIGPLHLLIVLVIALIIIGPGKLPSVGKALGESIREFRKSVSDVKESVSLEPTQATAPAVALPPPVAPASEPPVAAAASQPEATVLPRSDAKA